MTGESERHDGEGGYRYDVSDEQLRVFSALTPARRLAWLDEMRELTARLASPEAQRWWKRFREGR